MRTLWVQVTVGVVVLVAVGQKVNAGATTPEAIWRRAHQAIFADNRGTAFGRVELSGRMSIIRPTPLTRTIEIHFDSGRAFEWDEAVPSVGPTRSVISVEGAYFGGADGPLNPAPGEAVAPYLQRWAEYSMIFLATVPEPCGREAAKIGNRLIGGRPAVGLTLQGSCPGYVRVWVDAETFRIRLIESDVVALKVPVPGRPGNVPESAAPRRSVQRIVPSDFRVVNGVFLPWKVSLESALSAREILLTSATIGFAATSNTSKDRK